MSSPRATLGLLAAVMAVAGASGGADIPRPARRYKDPAVDPLGDPRPIGVGSKARVAKETRQLRRAREREEAKRR